MKGKVSSEKIKKIASHSLLSDTPTQTVHHTSMAEQAATKQTFLYEGPEPQASNLT